MSKVRVLDWETWSGRVTLNGNSLEGEKGAVAYLTVIGRVRRRGYASKTPRLKEGSHTPFEDHFLHSLVNVAWKLG